MPWWLSKQGWIDHEVTSSVQDLVRKKMDWIKSNKVAVGIGFTFLSGGIVALCGQDAALHTTSFCHYATIISGAIGSALVTAGITNSDSVAKAVVANKPDSHVASAARE